MTSHGIREVFIAAAVLLSSAYPAEPCSIARPVSPEEVVDGAETIVRAIAVEYAVSPSDPRMWTTGEPDSRVRFRVIEVVKGVLVSGEVVLPGYLTDRDDFNDHKPPYKFVRPGGRAGSCFANSYRKGAEFLLMLTGGHAGNYTVNWYALGPVNEQLESVDDAWLLWVRQQVKRHRAPAREALRPRVSQSAGVGRDDHTARLSARSLVSHRLGGLAIRRSREVGLPTVARNGRWRGGPPSLGSEAWPSYGGQPPHDHERRLVDQNSASWNQIAGWLRLVDSVRGA